MRCQCEYKEHPAACVNQATTTVETAYGKFALCKKCRDAGHMNHKEGRHNDCNTDVR